MANPIKPNTEIGVSGTISYQGIIRGEDYNQKLSGQMGIRNYEIARRSDSTVRAALNVCKLPLIRANWFIEPAKNKEGQVEAQDQFIADFVENQLFKNKLKFKRFLKEALTCLEFGFSVFEKVYIPITFEGKTLVGIAKLASRKQITIKRWETTDHQPGVTQQVNSDDYSIPLEKLVIFTYDKEGDNYEGQSILRSVFKNWDIKDKLTLIDAMAGERHAMGIATATAKDNITPDAADISKAEDVLSNIRANEALHMIIPNSFTVEMMDMKNSGNKDLLPSINYHDRRIFTGVQAGFMELGGSSGTGAQSLAETMADFLIKANEALGDELIEYINEQLVQQLCDLNFSDLPNGYPTLAVSDIADADTTARIGAITTAMSAGAISKDADIEEAVREMLDLPAMSDETREAYDHQDETITQDQKNDVVDVAKKTLEDTKDVKASLKAAEIYRRELISDLIKA